MKPILLLLAVLALAGCGMPMKTTHNGQQCHPVGAPWAPVWITADGKENCL